ncbi:hypothetical protein JOE63_001800 [Cellulosimicrobium cellulans]|jgi:hypothetical protein|uniref:Uncharacterized protein n=1 Tax=Cellulosimicrobium cellulans TaxID=1710 RepID=A0A1Y0HWS0_CELCE|nr:hypothetical protein [Cellulosimicrobium cellulans]ARU52632.1 hypothetical protein CBR64_15400 [Cellulosimicrobium cellulans]MBM7819323.1 hypothetical protein [Cellulosimicrobium cellulans]
MLSVVRRCRHIRTLEGEISMTVTMPELVGASAETWDDAIDALLDGVLDSELEITSCGGAITVSTWKTCRTV